MPVSDPAADTAQTRFFRQEREQSREWRQTMDKVKRIIALAGVVLLIGLYVGTLLLAVFGSDRTKDLLFAAIICTVIVPVLLWAYSFIYRLLKEHFSGTGSDKKEEKK